MVTTIKTLLVLLFSAATALAEDAPKLTIQSAEQAITRFREARSAELKTLLTKDQQKGVALCDRMSDLHVQFMFPNEFKGLETDPAYGQADPWLFGNYKSAAGSRNPTWHLVYKGKRFSPTIEVYLDAVTGKVLCLCFFGYM